MREDAQHAPENAAPEPKRKPKKRRPLWRRFLRAVTITLLILVGLLAIARPFMPRAVRRYVNRTRDRSPLYRGKIGEVELTRWRGAYAIRDVRLSKMTGDVPVPLFAADRVEFAIQWDALRAGKIVGRVHMEKPELNFVSGADESASQTGAGGPWLQIIRDLFPFRINRAEVADGAVHFRSYVTDPPVDVYLSDVQGAVDDLTNIRDETTPMVTTVRATARAMEQAKFEFQMKLDPFSYRPTFHMATRLLGLDVTKVNDLALAYGNFDFKGGFFDLVVEVDAKEGQMAGYVKPLFRQLKVFSLRKDIREDNVLEFFWEAILGIGTAIFKNQPRDQFGTLIPFTADAGGQTSTDILATVGNVLRNAFVRAYLPRLQRGGIDAEGLQFEAPRFDEAPAAVGAGADSSS
jgi:hypothetical protein